MFFGEDFPPRPEVFHFKTDDSLTHHFAEDSLAHKGMFIIKLDDLDSMPQGMNFQWKSKAGAMHHAMPRMKDCCKMNPKECAAMDSLCSPMMGKMHAQKGISVIKMDAKKGGEKELIIIRKEEGDDKKTLLIIIDGEESEEF